MSSLCLRYTTAHRIHDPKLCTLLGGLSLVTSSIPLLAQLVEALSHGIRQTYNVKMCWDSAKRQANPGPLRSSRPSFIGLSWTSSQNDRCTVLSVSILSFLRAYLVYSLSGLPRGSLFRSAAFLKRNTCKQLLVIKINKMARHAACTPIKVNGQRLIHRSIDRHIVVKYNSGSHNIEHKLGQTKPSLV